MCLEPEKAVKPLRVESNPHNRQFYEVIRPFLALDVSAFWACPLLGNLAGFWPIPEQARKATLNARLSGRSKNIRP